MTTTVAARRRISPAYRKGHTDGQHRATFNGGVTRTRPAWGASRRIRTRRRRAAGLLVAVTAIAGVLGAKALLVSSSVTVTIPARTPDPAPAPTTPAVPATAPRPRAEPGDGLGEDAGAVPAGTTVFDDGVPGVAKLDPALLGALRRAATDAAPDGVTFVVDSGWRSPAYQEHLLRQAVARYGSEAAAARWVARPDASLHVAGRAVDLGSAAAAWLSARGAAYGLCRVYGNEPWHYELRPQATTQGCPAMYPDPTHDPRMQRP